MFCKDWERAPPEFRFAWGWFMDIKNSIVAILKEHGNVAGTGFLACQELAVWELVIIGRKENAQNIVYFA